MSERNKLTKQAPIEEFWRAMGWEKEAAAHHLSDAEILRLWASMPKHHSVIEFARAVLAAAVVPRAVAHEGPQSDAVTNKPL